MKDYFTSKVQEELQNLITTNDVSAIFFEKDLRVIASCRTKRHNKPFVVSVNLKVRDNDQIKVLWNSRTKTKEVKETADNLIDIISRNLILLKEESNMYVSAALFGLEFYNGYVLPENRGKRRVIKSKEPKIADVKAKENEILAKHNELLEISLEESKRLQKYPNEEYPSFHMNGRVKNLLDYLKKLGIVEDYKKWSTEYSVEFTKNYKCHTFFVNDQWEKFLKELGYNAYSDSRSYWD